MALSEAAALRETPAPPASPIDATSSASPNAVTVRSNCDESNPVISAAVTGQIDLRHYYKPYEAVCSKTLGKKLVGLALAG
jgi:hypothetical protein